VHEIIRLAEHLSVVISGCSERKELIDRIAASPFVEILDSCPHAEAAACHQSKLAKLKASRQELDRRLAELDPRVCTAPNDAIMVGSGVGDLAGQIMSELRQTAARLDFQLNVNEASDASKSGGDVSDARQPYRTCLTSAGQSIVGSAITGGGA
jgi:hypothetical protein